MKRIFFAGTLALAACGQALAADLPPNPSAPPPRAPAAYVPAVAPTYNWGGVYIGINGGGGFGTSNWTNCCHADNYGRLQLVRGLVGGTLGANFQANQLVFGLETDLDWSNIKGSSTSAYCTTGIVATNCQTKNSYIGTARGRIGFAADRVLIFGTGGAAFGDVQTGLTYPTLSATYDKTNKVGWTGGGGVEVAFGENWDWQDRIPVRQSRIGKLFHGRELRGHHSANAGLGEIHRQSHPRRLQLQIRRRSIAGQAPLCTVHNKNKAPGCDLGL